MPNAVAVAVLMFVFWVPIVALVDKICHTAYVPRLTVAITGQEYTGFVDALLDINGDLLACALLLVLTATLTVVPVVGVVFVALMSLLSS